jgi:hypothetical protein
VPDKLRRKQCLSTLADSPLRPCCLLLPIQILWRENGRHHRCHFLRRRAIPAQQVVILNSDEAEATALALHVCSPCAWACPPPCWMQARGSDLTYDMYHRCKAGGKSCNVADSLLWLALPLASLPSMLLATRAWGALVAKSARNSFPPKNPCGQPSIGECSQGGAGLGPVRQKLGKSVH